MNCWWQKKIVLLLLLSLPCIAVAEVDDQKNNENSAIEEMRRLFETAELATQEQNFSVARNAYKEMLQLGGHTIGEDDVYFDIVLRLATTEAYLKEFAAAEDRLNRLLDENPSEEIQIQIETLRAQLRKKQNKSEEAYHILKDLVDLIPLKRWPAEERSFLVGLEYGLNRKYGETLRQAERLQGGGLFEEALPLYYEVLEAIEKGDYPSAVREEENGGENVKKIKLRLAETYYLYEDYGEAVALLEKMTEPALAKRGDQLSDVDNSAILLLGKAYKAMGKREHAITIFSHYRSLATDSSYLKYDDEAQWELGLLHYQRKDFEKAESFFKMLAHNSSNIKFYYLGRLYLAKMQLSQGNYEGVEHTLFPLLGIITEDEALRYEAAYLRGEAFFQRELFDKAAELFEQAIPRSNKEKAEWYSQTLYNLAWSYLKQGEATKNRQVLQAQYFDKAEKYFEELIGYNKDDRATLGLVRIYLLRGRYLNDITAQEEVEKVLKEKGDFKTEDLEGESLLLRAEVASTFIEKEKIYQELIKKKYVGTEAFALGWYYHGVNNFKEAERIKNEEAKPFEVEKLLTKAIAAFDKAFSLLKKSNKEIAALALKHSAEAHFLQKSKNSRKKAFALFEMLFTEHEEVFSGMENKDELLYLQGVVGARLLYEDGEEGYVSGVNDSLQKVIKEYPEGKFAPLALNLLGTIYFRQGDYEKAEQTFVQLARKYPNSEHAGNGWFWAGECADWQHKDPQVVREYRRQVFENFPSSKYAAEAYFNFYSFSEYLQGNTEALSHLQSMELLYPKSPFLVVAHYLVGMNHKQDRKANDGTIWKKADYTAAIHAFSEATKVFDKAYTHELIPTSNLEYFLNVRYRAMVELGLIKLKQGEEEEGAKQEVFLEWAANAFQKVINDFEEANHPLAGILMRGQSYPRILEESQYGLVKVYIKAGKDELAEEVLSGMLEKYAVAKIKRGYYLSRTWYEQGGIAMRRGEFELGLNFLKRAENAAKGKVLSREQKLDLWVEQSKCLREMKEYDEAMLMLSHVINEDAISSLRLKAMYLRAEIYELEGRHELAVKQLEATAKKGGDWANKAKIKLEKDYGFN